MTVEDNALKNLEKMGQARLAELNKEVLVPGQKPTIRYDEFLKLDLRLATINAVEEIPGADKLLKLTIDVGDLGERVICAGIKEFYPIPAILIGRRIVIVANLAPRKMKGVESHGMLLAASDKDHTQLQLITVLEDPSLPAGSVVG